MLLEGNLLKLLTKIKNTYSFCQNHNKDDTQKDIDEKFLLLSKNKGVYPYEYMDSFDKLEKTELPEYNDWFSKLHGTNISKSDYDHALKVWNVFNIKNMEEYQNLYVTSDTIQLSDVFEDFRNTALKTFKLDPCYFVSTPGLAWESCKKLTNQKLELLTDMDMILLFEEGIRGGITQSVTKYATANNKYMSTYDKNKPSNFIQYLDANGLYGAAMLRPLPTGNFEWVDPKEYNEETIKNIDIMGQKGYLFEVDIEYPRELWDKHKDLPFLAELRVINKTRKLVTTCQDKETYVVHISALQQALNHGLRLKKVHKVIKFDQSHDKCCLWQNYGKCA